MAAVSPQSHRPPSLNLRSDVWIGIAVAVALNGAMLVALLRWTAMPLRESVVADSFLTVVWIPRTPPARPMPALPVRAPVVQRAGRGSRMKRASSPYTAAGISHPRAAVATSPEDAVATRPLQVIYDDPLAGVSFRKNILVHQRPDAFGAPRPSTFHIRDMSVGGRLQRMARGAECGELRRALRSASGSNVDAIVRTMEERGCS